MLYENLTPWDKLTLARTVERPTSLDYINNIFDKFIEFHGDRYYGDDSALVGGIASINGIKVTVIGQQKGGNIKENIERNFGMVKPEGYRKSLRLMKQAEKFKRPIICFIDTPGAYCGVEAEERGQGEAIARNLMEMASLNVPILSIIIGEGGSGGALALAASEKVYMLENSIYSLLSPEGFASILWKDSSRSKEAAEAMKITAKDLLFRGFIDGIIKEPAGGAHKDLEYMALNIKKLIIKELMGFSKLEPGEAIKLRHEKIRKIGEYRE
ncbi:MAG: acetyl-CoA carboxylase carboxyltransferase subunit alpha [Clostridiaceae bacterium]